MLNGNVVILFSFFLSLTAHFCQFDLIKNKKCIIIAKRKKKTNKCVCSKKNFRLQQFPRILNPITGSQSAASATRWNLDVGRRFQWELFSCNNLMRNSFSGGGGSLQFACKHWGFFSLSFSLSLTAS